MPGLKIIKASAGSGKTWTLSLEYLRLLLRPGESHTHILAVTFTNKATEEMRVRILKELSLLANGEQTQMGNRLMSELGINEKELFQRAKHMLGAILHDYSGFSITTIDSFFQRILKAFARETGLPLMATVELQSEKVLAETIDHIFFELDRYPMLKDWLLAMSLDQIEEGNNWDIRNDLRKLGQELLKENFPIPQNVSPEELNQKKQAFYQELRTLKKILGFRLEKIADEVDELLKSHGLTYDDFFRKSGGIIGFFAKLRNSKIPEPTITILQGVNSLDAWVSRKSPHLQLIESLSSSKLQPLLRESLQIIRRLRSALLVLKYYHVWGILEDLGMVMREKARDDNIYLLADTPKVLRELIANNDTPFLYERAGNRWKHIMIDEFQDTSVLQWDNFKPLIENSISSGNTCILVGDVKQSIYRWRNGDWRILGYQAEDQFSSLSESTSLPWNFRSHKEIIQFNNLFFNEAKKLLQDNFNSCLPQNLLDGPLSSMILNAYSDSTQTPTPSAPEKGWVQLRFFEKTDKAELAYDQIAGIISGLLSAGYKMKDIGILFREKKHGKSLASYLTNHSNLPPGSPVIDIVSGESLFLINSPAVNSLVCALRLIEKPADQINITRFIREYFLYLGKYTPTSASLPPPTIPANELIQLLPPAFQSQMDELCTLPVSLASERICSILGLVEDPVHLPYIDSFLDQVSRLASVHISDIHSFLDWWEEEGDDLALEVPGEQDAIRMMTIHKAKGLEFPIVLLPDCCLALDSSASHRNIHWCSTDDPVIGKEGAVPVKLSKNLKDSLFENEYYNELMQSYIDQFNLLYVAFTRAKQGLYILSPKPDDPSKLNDTSQLLYKIVPQLSGLKKINLSETGTTEVFESGDIQQPYQPEQVRKEMMEMPVWSHGKGPKLKLRRRAQEYFDTENINSVNEGILLHQLFENIKLISDIQPAIRQMEANGLLNHDLAEKLRLSIPAIFTDKEVASWFEAGWRLRNEGEILLPGGPIKRPDRLMYNDQTTMVIEYKFGLSEQADYVVQLKEYLGLLKQAGFPDPNGVVWYVRKGTKIYVKPD